MSSQHFTEMKDRRQRLSRPRIIRIAALVLLFSPHAAFGADALWEIIQHCLQPTIENYCSTCRSPLNTANCPASKGCFTSTQLWDTTPDYVAISDRKACGCGPGFVHGLVLPRNRVVGTEDPLKPDGIWQYAWGQATSRIPEVSSIALVVNSSDFRSQAQLHIHVVRLRNNARPAIESRASIIPSLKDVWTAAHKQALAAQLGQVYGILITRSVDSGFLMVVENTPLERLYTENVCTH